MKYKTSLNTLSLVITILVTTMLLYFAYISLLVILNGQVNNQAKISYAFVLIISLGIIIISYLHSTHGYILEETQLVIKRPMGRIKIGYKDIVSIEKLNLTGASIRTFGNGGLFGFYGKYFNVQIGNLILYTTRTDNRILIKTRQGSNIVISPNDMGLFDAMSARIQKS